MRLLARDVLKRPYGSIADNAQGINEIAGADEKARRICNRLDAAGNTTKALT